VNQVEQLSCRELVELVTDYFEDALAPAERARFEQHLAACGGCTRYVEQLRATVAAVGRLEPEAVPPDAEAALLEAFRDWKTGI
jgi:anti-sigma factor RsiW